jgi:pyruvate/2-oxoglutarate dehydrogenase complex dihydrolipoamide acyltransferase (E2) component
MSSSSTEALLDVLMPAMGTSITEATVIEWRKQVGDDVTVDETICEISTDKIDAECPAPAGGTVAEILVPTGETVDVGTVIARIASSGAPTEVNGSGPDPAAPVSASAARPEPAAGGSGAAPATESAAPGFSPVVARMLAAHELDATTIVGTGRNGRITKKDVLAVIEAPAEAAAKAPLHSDSPHRPEPAVEPSPTQASPAGQKALPAPQTASEELGGVPDQLSRIRQTIGARMRASQETAATCHTIVECDMTAVEARRRELGLTALPLVARGTVDTLREFPELNATLDGATITRYQRVHLGIAVSLGAEGLIVPVVRDAQNLSAEGLGARIRDLASRVRSRELLPDEVRGATFTITNPGAYGAVVATPVIDLPQVGILDLEAIVRRPVAVTLDGQESIAIRSIVNLILGWDHRAIDGVYAAQFLSALRARLERPAI